MREKCNSLDARPKTPLETDRREVVEECGTGAVREERAKYMAREQQIDEGENQGRY